MDFAKPPLPPRTLPAALERLPAKVRCIKHRRPTSLPAFPYHTFAQVGDPVATRLIRRHDLRSFDASS